MSDKEYRKNAISYIRFSTAKQALGNSYKRQFEEAEEFCKKKGITIQKEYKDLGRSAYKNFNLMPGSDLAFFLQELKDGKVANPKDTYLLVESLDRLSRSHVTQSLSTFTQILNLDIAIITLSDSKIYDKKNSNEQQMVDFITSIMLMAKAHAESKDKSYRIASAWKDRKETIRKKAERGEIQVLTKMCPFWLEVTERDNGVFFYQQRPDYVATIKLIFDLATGQYDQKKFEDVFENKINKFEKLKEKEQRENPNKRMRLSLEHLSLSSNEIVKLLHALKIPILKSGKRKKSSYWHTSNINKILTNIALMGTYQPKKLVHFDTDVFDENRNKYEVTKSKYENDGKAIENFYPVIISKEQFANAQRFKTKRQKGIKGRKGKKFSNLFNGLAQCRLCGSSMVHNDKGKSKTGKRWVYLQCSKARTGAGCEYVSANYAVAEQNVLKFMRGSDFSPIVGNPEKDQNQIDKTANRITILKEKIAEIDKEAIHLIKTAIKGFEKAVQAEVDGLAKKKTECEKRLEIEQREHSYLVANQITEKFDKKSFSRLVKNIDLDNPSASTEDIYFSRMKANSIISNVVENLLVDAPAKKITLIYFDGSAQVIDINLLFDDEGIVIPNINVPVLHFCKNTQEEEKVLIERYCYQYSGEALDGFLNNSKIGNITSDNMKQFGVISSKILAKSVDSFAANQNFNFTKNKDGYFFSKRK